MEQVLNGHRNEEVHQKLDVEEDGELVIEEGIEAQVDADDETLRMSSVVVDEGLEVTVIENGVGNGKEEKGLVSSSSSSSSSSDEEEASAFVMKTDETEFASIEIYDEEENGVANLTVKEEAVEVEFSPVTEELNDVEVIEEHISEVKVIEELTDEVEEVIEEHISEVSVIEEHVSEVTVTEETTDEAKETVEEEREVIIPDGSETVEAVAVELADVVSDPVESAEEVLSAVLEQREAEYAAQEGTNGTLQSRKEEDTFPANDKSNIGTNDTSQKAELLETNGNPQIISISARTMQPTSWRGCCGLLEVFKRGDR